MAKIRLIFVEKLANSWLLAAFSASISQIFSHFFLRVLLVQSSLVIQFDLNLFEDSVNRDGIHADRFGARGFPVVGGAHAG